MTTFSAPQLSQSHCKQVPGADVRQCAGLFQYAIKFFGRREDFDRCVVHASVAHAAWADPMAHHQGTNSVTCITASGLHVPVLLTMAPVCQDTNACGAPCAVFSLHSNAGWGASGQTADSAGCLCAERQRCTSTTSCAQRCRRSTSPAATPTAQCRAPAASCSALSSLLHSSGRKRACAALRCCAQTLL